MIVTIHQAKTQLSRLVEAALHGEEVIIARGKHPVVRLQVLPMSKAHREPGGLRGVIGSPKSDFDEPLEDFKDY